MRWKRFAIWTAAVIAVAALIVVLLVRLNVWRPRSVTIQGVVLRHDEDPDKQLPLAGVTVTATDGMMTETTQSDASGYFRLRFRENFWPGHALQVMFRKSDYKDFDMTVPLSYRGSSDRLYVADLAPLAPEAEEQPEKKEVRVTNIRIRYTENTEGDENIGSAVRTFQVENKGNVPCKGQAPCSPDGKWKAAVGSATLDAGSGNEFRNPRASCIAGPCPFTRIDSSGFERGGRVITASALDWSDTATFLVEAEVFRKSINSSVRESYPAVFGRALNFILPPTQEGVSIEADLDGAPMVFPLGPELYLSWATCSSRSSRDNASSTVYRCELKPGYRF